MRKLYSIALMSMIAAPALAGKAPQVPEMSAGAGIAAVALLVGAVAILRERKK